MTTRFKSIRRPGRAPSTGPFLTRAEYAREVKWLYEHTDMSMEAIAKRFKCSAPTIAKLIEEAP